MPAPWALQINTPPTFATQVSTLIWFPGEATREGGEAAAVVFGGTAAVDWVERLDEQPRGQPLHRKFAGHWS